LDKPERIIDLKETSFFIDQYVDLRNSYCNLLLTEPVTVSGTNAWIKSRDIEVRCAVCGNVLLGSVILYLTRDGEVTYFVKEKNKGLGSRLLEIIEKVAGEKNLKKIWAWVLSDNVIAQHTFLKNGYKMKETSIKKFQNQMRDGFVFEKILSEDVA